jgi:hypothetical protein
MGIALWCDAKDKGHAFDERDAIVVNYAGDAQYFCRAHCIPAFVTAFHLARAHGQAGIFLPTLGGAFTLTPDTSHPAPPSQPGNGQQQASASPGDGGNAAGGQAQNARPAARSGKDSTPRGEQSRETVQAITEMLEQMPRRATASPASVNYGGRA